MAGRVHFYVSPTLGVVPQYEEKLLKILAVSAPERLKNLPDIPTLTEKGIDFVRFGWLGICTGAGTPQPIIERLHRDIVAIVATPEYTRDDREGRLDRSVVDAGRVEHHHHADAGRGLVQHPRIRPAAGISMIPKSCRLFG